MVRLEMHMEQICSLLQELVKPVRQKRIEQTVLAELRTKRIKYLREPPSSPPRATMTVIQYHAYLEEQRTELEERRAELEELEEEAYIAEKVKKRLKYERTKKNSRSRIEKNEICGELEELENENEDEDEDDIALEVEESSK